MWGPEAVLDITIMLKDSIELHAIPFHFFLINSF